ncbi:hypothetical protein LP419_34005 [Massilia sp. H-1]|nr:hypothetical protein LP419_34005 [Massilia sp. H-1]
MLGQRDPGLAGLLGGLMPVPQHGLPFQQYGLPQQQFSLPQQPFGMPLPFAIPPGFGFVPW